MTLYPPAKINLSLRITRRREDGFHELETLILPLPSLTDRLVFSEANTYSLSCDLADVPVDESNLITKALRLFEKETGIACPFQISLEKRIPHGAGLGGGSADAAHTLLALNKLTNCHLSLEELAELAGQLGSDIPLFLYQKPCWCRGRGEIIDPTELRLSRGFVLFKPLFGVSTPWAYSRWKDSKEIPEVPYTPQHVEDMVLINDLEKPVFEKYRFLAALKLFLLRQPETSAALMTGSGSTMFALLKEGADAKNLIKRTLTAMDPTMWTHYHPPLD